MAERSPSVVDRLRRPEYTGENRCWPCTVANTGIAIGVSLVVGAGLAWNGTPARIAAAAGAGVLGVSLAAIYFRGYLVPGTPTVTKRYFPERVLRAFDKHPAGRDTGGETGIDREAVLKDAGVVEDCQRVDDLCLTGEFREAWRERIRHVRERDTDAVHAELAAVLGLTESELTVQPFDDAFVARVGPTRVGQWESEAAFVADMAAAGELRTRVDGWATLPVGERGELLNRLRIFIETCPACDGPVAVGEEVIESCCRSIDVVAVSCQACGARLFEAEHPA